MAKQAVSYSGTLTIMVMTSVKITVDGIRGASVFQKFCF